jgi:hypothetical protein
MGSPLVELLTAIQALVASALLVVRLLGTLAWPWLPLVVWAVYWLLLVDWSRLLPVLSRGGWLVIAMVFVVGLSVWSLTVPVIPEGERWLGLLVDSVVAKFLNASVLVAVAVVAGAIQLSGLFPSPAAGRPRDFQATSSEDVVHRIPNV